MGYISGDNSYVVNNRRDGTGDGENQSMNANASKLSRIDRRGGKISGEKGSHDRQ